MARKKKPDPHAHAESWLVSYCDMISLLVTFFLMMMTFSTSSDHDVRAVGVGMLRGRGGVWKSPVSYPEQTEVEPKVAEALSRNLAALMVDEEGNQKASMRQVSDGFAVSFDLRSSFAEGSAEINDALRANLADLAAALSRYTHLIIVEGFDDDAFKGNASFPDSAEVSLARAIAAAEVLRDAAGLPPELVQVSSHGAFRPRASNSTADGRKSNRRIEVRVAAVGLPRIARQMLEEREKE